jgi:hypothetical protein
MSSLRKHGTELDMVMNNGLEKPGTRPIVRYAPWWQMTHSVWLIYYLDLEKFTHYHDKIKKIYMVAKSC